VNDKHPIVESQASGKANGARGATSNKDGGRPLSDVQNAAFARARKLSPKRRSEIAKKAAEARWSADDESESIPREEFAGDLVIGTTRLECAVLSNRERVFSERAVFRMFGTRTGGTRWMRKAKSEDGYLPPVLAARNLAPFIPASLRVALAAPIPYRPKRGGSTALGTRAELLPEMCRVLLDARRAGKLTERQEKLASTAELLVTALARVGIIALVDEATGYQEVRERDELRRILEAYISKELLGWTLRFPPEFYKELFRLRGWQWNPDSSRRPRRVGKDTDYIVYDRLPPGVKDELKRKNPPIRPGYRRYKNFQFLTADVGDPHLERIIIATTALMRASTSWAKFKRLLERAIPIPTLQKSFAETDPSFVVPEADDEEEDGEG
jgi:hypothetical protein